MKSRRVLVSVALAALGTVGLAACGSSGGSKVVETPDGKVTVGKDGKSVTIQGEHGGRATFGGTDVPDGFPSVVPQPEGLKIKTSAGGDQSGKQFFTIGYDLASQSPKTATAAYQHRLEGGGFTVDNSASFGSGATAVNSFSATGKGYRVAVTATGTGHVLTLVVTNAA